MERQKHVMRRPDWCVRPGGPAGFEKKVFISFYCRRTRGSFEALSMDRQMKNFLFFFALLIFKYRAALAAGPCCDRPIFIYPSGIGIPPGCMDSKCSKSSIHIESSEIANVKALNFLRDITKTGTLSVFDAPKDLSFKGLREIVHNGPGPALHIKDVHLDTDSFAKLKKITVDDPLRYCEKRDLVIIGDIDAVVKERLEKVANKALSVCDAGKASEVQGYFSDPSVFQGLLVGGPIALAVLLIVLTTALKKIISRKRREEVKEQSNISTPTKASS
ncbi:unnamed protein product [Caenorhabditis auriculariae]|uniref:Uncharacterized protein n=1 Tax=Caenorhabditis auriculariae TaxID=2777116 RepID=A0A8S1HHF1_9PELO|nr:unnamed protein product [Caenorhabditis auriculariae]